MRRERSTSGTASGHERLAVGLGWFSLGLGAAELLAPGAMARMIGLRDTDETRSVLRLYGMREIGAGLGILMQPDNPTWVWGRVGGDLLDFSSLLKAEEDPYSGGRRTFAAVGIAGATAIDAICALGLSQQDDEYAADDSEESNTAREAITIDDSAYRIYSFWRDFQNLPRFMRHLESVHTSGVRTSHWRAKGPGGTTVEWDAEVTEDVPGQRISWRSVGPATVSNFGTVTFERAPGGRGTAVHVEIHYSLPGGRAAASVARLFGMAPQQLIREDLRRLKQIIELGEVVHSEASIHESIHPAQPPQRVAAHMDAGPGESIGS